MGLSCLYFLRSEQAWSKSEFAPMHHQNRDIRQAPSENRSDQRRPDILQVRGGYFRLKAQCAQPGIRPTRTDSLRRPEFESGVPLGGKIDLHRSDDCRVRRKAR